MELLKEGASGCYHLVRTVETCLLHKIATSFEAYSLTHPQVLKPMSHSAYDALNFVHPVSTGFDR